MRKYMLNNIKKVRKFGFLTFFLYIYPKFEVMKKYKIADFMHENLNSFLEREIIITFPVFRLRGKIIDTHNDGKSIRVKGILSGRTLLGQVFQSQIGIYGVSISKMITNYKTDHIQIIILDETSN